MGGLLPTRESVAARGSRKPALTMMALVLQHAELGVPAVTAASQQLHGGAGGGKRARGRPRKSQPDAQSRSVSPSPPRKKPAQDAGNSCFLCDRVVEGRLKIVENRRVCDACKDLYDAISKS